MHFVRRRGQKRKRRSVSGTLGLGLAAAAGDTTTIGPWTALLPKNTKSRLADVIDGLSNRIAFAESAGRPYVYRRGGKLVDGNTLVHRVNAGGLVATRERLQYRRIKP